MFSVVFGVSGITVYMDILYGPCMDMHGLDLQILYMIWW